MVEDDSGGVFNETIADLMVVVNDLLAAIRNAIDLVEGKAQKNDGLYLAFQGASKGMCAVKNAVTIAAPETFDIEAGIYSDSEGQRQQAEDQDASFQRIFHIFVGKPPGIHKMVGKQDFDVMIRLHMKASRFFNTKLRTRATGIVPKTIKNG